MLSFQQIIDNLLNYWITKGCLQMHAYDMEMGAATFHPATALKAIEKNLESSLYSTL